MPSKIQGSDIKTTAELISAGATAADLPKDTQVYLTANSLNKTLKDAIEAGDISGGFTNTATQSIAAAGTITVSTTRSMQILRVQGNAGAQTSSTTPFGAGGGWADGAMFVILGKDDTNTLTIPHNDAAKGFMLNGDAILNKDSILAVMYLSTEDRFQELYRIIY